MGEEYGILGLGILSRFGFRARVALLLISRKGEWMSVEDIGRITGLKPSSVKMAIRDLREMFPMLFEVDKEGRMRFVGIFGPP